MNWKEFLKSEIGYTFKVTEGLLDLVDADKLAWKPSGENNWMTTGQLLMHLTTGCGAGMRGFVTGEWDMPEDIDFNELSQEEMQPKAEQMPTIGSVEETRELLAQDKQLAFDMLAKCSEEELAGKIAAAPWDPTEMILGYRLFQMISHLTHHKSQLFYYLKLQGKPVNTRNLWGM